MANGDANDSRDEDHGSQDLCDSASTAPMSSDAAEARRIGPYRLLSSLGSGGMGEVFLAEQLAPIKRRVALKLIKEGMDTREVIARFESERQALALMDHPNVARIHDAGNTETGRPYFVMEYVPGEPITDYCDRQKLDLRGRLELFVSVCQAIHHAHQKGIIHRDIKPTNVLVTVVDGRPVPKVIDFGIAKAVHQPLTDKTVDTLQGKLLGTPAYMSPEQAEPTGLGIDTTSDVYSLGVLLYELLVGVQPFDPKQLMAAGIAEIFRIIREVDPPKPSTKISTLGEQATEIAAKRRSEVRTWRRQLHGELDWITMRAMEKDRSRRYPSASEFAADVQRYLVDDPVAAGPPSTAYRINKFFKRNRKSLVTASVVVLLLVVSAITTFTTIHEKRTREVEARQARQREDVNALLSWRRTTDRMGAEKVDSPYRAILAGICDRLRDGTATQLDCEAFVRFYFGADLDGRPLVEIGNDSAIRFGVSVTTLWADLADGLGALMTPELQMDGEAIRAPRCPEGCLAWIPDWWDDGALSKSYATSGYIRTPSTIGPHRVSGVLRADIVDLPKRSYAWWPLDCRSDPASCDVTVISASTIILEVPELNFTVVQSFPSDYPPLIMDHAEARRIKEGFQVVQSSLAMRSETGNCDSLFVAVSIPAPKIRMAVEVVLADLSRNWSESVQVVARHSGIGGSHRSGARDAPHVRFVAGPASDDGRRLFVSIALPLDRTAGRYLEAGDSLQVSMFSSAEVARRDPKVSEYLDFRHSIATEIVEGE